MFSDPVTNPMRWEDRKTLGEVAEIVSGITKGRKLNGSATRPVPYLAVANVQDKELRLEEVKVIEATEEEVNCQDPGDCSRMKQTDPAFFGTTLGAPLRG